MATQWSGVLWRTAQDYRRAAEANRADGDEVRARQCERYAEECERQCTVLAEIGER